jgi:hypothetical protein
MNIGTKGTQEKHPYFSFVVWMDPLCGNKINHIILHKASSETKVKSSVYIAKALGMW